MKYLHSPGIVSGHWDFRRTGTENRNKHVGSQSQLSGQPTHLAWAFIHFIAALPAVLSLVYQIF